MTSYVNDVDLLARLSGYGDLSSAMKNTLMGFNHRNFGSPVPFNAENHGIAFFTRPRLNLSYDNVMADRILQPLLTNDSATLQRAIRVMLDPVNANGYITTKGMLDPITSQLFDNRQAFLPLLSNNHLSSSGWPDPSLQYFDATPGPTKETWTKADDTIDIRYAWDATINFRNILGDPITLMFLVWLRYISNVNSGLMTPFPDEIIENRIDYQTAFIRFTLDPSRRYIQKWSRTIMAPQSVPLGAAMDYSTDGPFNLNNANQISIPFHCIGAEYMDPILLTEFNLLVMAFNPDMYYATRSQKMVQVPYDELGYFNFYGYPWVDNRTNELKWFVYKEDYQALLDQLKQYGHTAPNNQAGVTAGAATTYGMQNRVPKLEDEFEQ